MIRWFRIALGLVVLLVGWSAGGRAPACDRCRQLGTSLFHDEGLERAPVAGGDALDDALHAVGEPGGGSAGFVPPSSKWPQPNGLGTRVDVTYSFENMFDGGILMPNGKPLPNWIIRRSIEEAFRVWAAVVPIHFREVPDNGLPYGNPNATYGDIRIRHRFLGGPDPIPGPGQTEESVALRKAQAYFPFGGVLAGDVEFDNGDRWQLSGTIPQPDILGAMIHELGHSLGLEHTSVRPANMYPIFIRYSGLGQGRLYPDDIAAVQYNYGVGVGSVTSLVPEPAAMLLLAGGALYWWTLRRRPSRNGSAI